ncbi:Chromosome transmission fidelity protein [Nymphaea thermarum]|nr:Chromosome transmission fidelity protein [Nymphaea thermarum]
MEIDFPPSDELEWLENSILDEAMAAEEEAEDNDVDDFEPPLPAAATPIFQAHKKRPQSDPNNFNDGFVSEKRIRSPIHAEDQPQDEDWLRYSPREVSRGGDRLAKDRAVHDAMEMDSGSGVSCRSSLEDEENMPCRFASDIEGGFMPVTGPDGTRVYARLCASEKNDCFSLRSGGRPEKCLLLEPVRILLERVEQEAFLKACDTSAGSIDDTANLLEVTNNEQLWVDKYAPRSFTELLSDEKTNREVLYWLKEWDSCVFGSKIRATEDDVLTNLRRHSSASISHRFSHNKSSFYGRKGAPFSTDEGFNESNGTDRQKWNQREKKGGNDGPPQAKVLLLCGAPGLGKTTLAHVAAKHCGYRVVEINASDDRSASTIEGKILDVVQMNSVTGDAKPKCLVIDEIDGALGEGKGAVDVILKLLAAEKKAIAGSGKVTREPNAEKVSAKKETKSTRLLRPVICICNDLYAPALRPLRQVAKLKYICNNEGFRTNSLALTVLAEYTECDIRSCLNTLQFLCKKKETLNILDVGSQVIGRKDISKGIFETWKEIFQRRKSKGKRVALNNCNPEPADFDRLHNLISNGGDYDVTVDGIHENFLQLRYHDPALEKTVKCFDVLGSSDLIFRRIMQTQQMSLYAYQPSVMIAIRSLVSQLDQPNIEWPKSYQRYRAGLMEKREMFKNWHSKILPVISRHLSAESFIEDVISPLLHILSPPTLRPVALHLLTEREKEDLKQLVDTMISYSVNYKNKEPTSTNILANEVILKASSLTLDPPFLEFINYKDSCCQHPGLPLAVRQVVVHEVEKEKILRESVGRTTESKAEGGKPEAISHAMSGCASNSAKILSNHKQLQNPPPASDKSSSAPSFKSNDIKRSCSSFNFFDRFRKSSSRGSSDANTSAQQSATSERDSRPLLFKFNEGFTNAVKRPVRVCELLS